MINQGIPDTRERQGSKRTYLGYGIDRLWDLDRSVHVANSLSSLTLTLARAWSFIILEPHHINTLSSVFL